MGNIQDGRIDASDLKYLPSGHDEFPKLMLREGDLLFNRTNSAELVGKSAVYTGNPSPCSYASYLIALRFTPACNPKYLNYYLNSQCGRRWVRSVVSQQVGQAKRFVSLIWGSRFVRQQIEKKARTTAGIYKISQQNILDFVLPLPPVDEQQFILAEVEQRLSVIAVAEAQIEANLQRARRLRQSILKEALAGRLVPQDPDDEPAEALLARLRAKRQAGLAGKGTRARNG